MWTEMVRLALLSAPLPVIPVVGPLSDSGYGVHRLAGHGSLPGCDFVLPELALYYFCEILQAPAEDLAPFAVSQALVHQGT